MINGYVDLHIHSYYSDGTMSINEIIDEALQKGVTTLSVTDHNLLEGAKELMKIGSLKGITCFSGVELDAIYNNINFHVLAYGVDLDSVDFNKKVFYIRNIYNSCNMESIIFWCWKCKWDFL